MCVRHLVEVGAHKDQATDDGAMPLFIAAQEGHLDVVRHLVKLVPTKIKLRTMAQRHC